MVYEFRKLNSTDVFKMIRVIKKLNVKDLADCFDSDAINKLVEEKRAESEEEIEEEIEEVEISVGIDVVFKIADVILCNLENCESELYDLLSNCSNLSVEQIKRLDIDIFLKMIIEFLQKQELKDFIKVVLKLVK